MESTSTKYSQKQLDQAPDRALSFLRGATLPGIREQLASVGYAEGTQKEGWSLLMAAADYGVAAPVASPAQEAMTELVAWCAPGFHRVHAALAHLFPAQEAKVFAAGLAASGGADAVVAVGMLLDRLDGLASSKDAKDKGAIAELAARGIDKTERARLRTLFESAKGATLPTAPADATARTEALVALRDWYEDWAETAKAVINKRGDLIRLGLAKRQPRSATTTTPTGPTDGTTTSPATPAPTPTPTPPATASSPSSLALSGGVAIVPQNGVGAH